MVGAIFAALGIFRVAWPSGLWSWNIGITIDVALLEMNSAVVSLNIANFVLCILFLKAYKNRKVLANVTANT